METKTVSFICLLLLLANVSFSQKKTQAEYSIDSICEYKLLNSNIKDPIDFVISQTENCPYYSVLHKPYLIWICIYDTSLISVNSIPYNNTEISNRRSDGRKREDGICHYNGHFIFIQSFISNSICRFFQKTGGEKTLRYHNSENILDHIHSASENVEIFYTVKDGEFIHQEDDISLCRNDYSFYYMIQQGDSWLDMAEKCGCPAEDLAKEYPEMEIPMAGYLIMVRYLFENGKLMGVAKMP